MILHFQFPWYMGIITLPFIAVSKVSGACSRTKRWLQGWRKCPECNGAGSEYDSYDEVKDCWFCDGRGEYNVRGKDV